MSHEKEPNQEIPAENGENNGEEIDVVKEGDFKTEEEVAPETSGEAQQEVDQESLQEPGAGIYEAPLDENEE